MNIPQSTGATLVPLSRIVAGDNPRRYFDRAKHEQLVTSFRLRGMLQPIVVRPKDDRLAIVAGERRWRAALEVFGPDGEILVLIREMTDQEAIEAAIDENDARDDASETEQADAAARILVACHEDRAEAAARLGWSRAKLDRRLALATLSHPVKLALDERRIKVGHAELLAAVPPDKQDKALETILTSGLDVAKTRDLLMRVTQDLANACFDKTECITCPFNSGTQRALFETHVDDGHCTNPGCFGLKTQAAEVIRFEEEERAAKAARATDPAAGGETEDDEADAGADSPAAPEDLTEFAQEAVSPPSGCVREAGPSGSRNSAPTAAKPTVTAKSIAARTTDLREATWRIALARALARNAAHARTTILFAAMSGTLSQIRAETLTSRAGLLVGAAFPGLDYAGKIQAIRALSDPQAATVLAVTGAAYAKDALSFAHVAELARTFDIDLRASWAVDQAFLERFTKDELKFIAQECGLIAHVGAKGFAKLLAGKKSDLITGMLNRTGFDWAGRLPSAMTLDGEYGPPPSPDARSVEPRVAELAA